MGISLGIRGLGLFIRWSLDKLLRRDDFCCRGCIGLDMLGVIVLDFGMLGIMGLKCLSEFILGFIILGFCLRDLKEDLRGFWENMLCELKIFCEIIGGELRGLL